MSFPSLLSTISFAHLRPSPSSSLSFARSFSTSSVSLGSFLGLSSPFPSLSSSFPSTAPPPPSSSRSYHSSSKPVFASSSRPSLSRPSSTLPPARPTPRSKPPSPPKPKPWALPPKVVQKRSKSELERMEELQDNEWEGMKFIELPKEEQKELRGLEKKHKLAKLALAELAFNKEYGFEPMDGSSANLELKRWFEELPKKHLTETNVWKEFVTAEHKFTFFPSLSSSPRDRDLVEKGKSKGSLHFEDPVVDTKLGFILPMMVALFGTFALYLVAAILTDRASLKSEASGSTSWLLGPWGGWIVATALLSFACFVPHWLKNAPDRLAAHFKRTSRNPRGFRSYLDLLLIGLNVPRAMEVFTWRPLVRSHFQVWLSMFGHGDNGHLYGNLKGLVTGGFFAFYFFDDRSPFSDWFSPLFREATSWLNETLFGGWFEQHDDGWIVPRLRQVPGWLNENWALSSNDSTTSEPARPSTGLYHFLVFCLTASAFSFLFFDQAGHTLSTVPKASKTLLRILKDPKELRRQEPPWFFDPQEKRIRMGPTIQSRIDCLSSLGLSQTTMATKSLALATITFACWNPIMLIPQYQISKQLFYDLKATWKGESAAGDFGHVPGILFGFFYFFVGATVWDWFLDRAKLIRRRETDTALLYSPVDVESSISVETEGKEETSSPLVDDTPSLDPSTPSSSPSPSPDPLPTSSSEIVGGSSSPHESPPEPAEEPPKPRGRWWWTS